MFMYNGRVHMVQSIKTERDGREKHSCTDRFSLSLSICVCAFVRLSRLCPPRLGWQVVKTSTIQSIQSVQSLTLAKYEQAIMQYSASVLENCPLAFVMYTLLAARPGDVTKSIPADRVWTHCTDGSISNRGMKKRRSENET